MTYFRLSILTFTLSLLAASFVVSTPVLAKSKVEVRSKDCKRLLRHRNDGAAYKGGVDVRGKKVKGADLHGGSPIKLPKVLSFDINADMTKYMSDGAKDKLGDVDAKIGTIKYDINSGAMTFNGKPLTNRDEAELRAHCKQALTGP